MNTAQSDHIQAVRGMEALLSRLLEEIDGGLLTTIENHAIAVTFDDFLDHGAEYLKDGRKNEAAVISASRRARFAVSRDSTSSNVIPDGSTAVVDPDRHRARNPAAHSPVDTRTVPVSAGDAAARRCSLPFQREHGLLDVLRRREQLLSGGVEAEPLG